MTPATIGIPHKGLAHAAMCMRPLELSDEERGALRTMIERDGLVATAKRLGSSRDSLTRAVAGLSVRSGTTALIRASLAEGRTER